MIRLTWLLRSVLYAFYIYSFTTIDYQINLNQQMDSSGTLQDEVCQVCRSGRFDDNIFERLVCRECKRFVHKFCYAPDIRDKKHFKCDQCRKGCQESCYFCMQKNGILKNVGEKIWTHVLCALSSTKIKLQSYRSLDLKIVKESKDQLQQRRKCMICLKESAEVFQCWLPECDSYVHVGCIVGYKFPKEKQFYLTFGFLDKHNNILMNHLKDYSDQFQSFKYMRSKRIRPVLCVEHNDDPYFIFCNCGKTNFKKGRQQKIFQVSCNICKRWFHLSCTNVQDPDKQDFDCNGCKQNNFYKKGVYLPELIEKMGEIQTSGKICKQAIQLLDSFILKFSNSLIEFCLQKKSKQEINKYYYRRVLQRISSQEKFKQSIKLKQQKILELLYLLAKNTYLQYQRISEKKIEQIIDVMNNDKSTIGLQNEAFLKYKRHLQNKLKQNIKQRSQRPPENVIIEVLTLYKQNLENNKFQSFQTLVKQTKQLFNQLDKNQLANQAYPQSKFFNYFFEIFFKSNVTEQILKIVFNKFRRISYLSPECLITESEYLQIVNTKGPQFKVLPHEKKLQLSQLYMQKLKNFKILFDYEQKQILLNKAFNKITAGLIPRQTCLIRKEIAGNLMFLAADSQLCLSDYTEMFFSIKKRKLLKGICSPLQEQIQDIMDQLKNYLSNPNLPYNFTKQEKKQIDKFLNRSRFYLRIVSQQTRLRSSQKFQDVQDQEQLDYQKICALGGLESLQLLAFEAMNNWEQQKQSINAGFIALNDVCQSEVQFTTAQKQIVSKFAQKILDSYCQFEPQLRTKGALQSSNLTKIIKIVNFFDLQQNYKYYLECSKIYNEWKKDLLKFQPVSKSLEDPYKVTELYNTINSRLFEATYCNIDLSNEVKKLKTIKVWTVISKKFLVDSSNTKLTISALREVKLLIQRSQYPDNLIKKNISRLDAQARRFQQKFKFSKSKMPNDIQIHEEIGCLRKKQKIEDAQILIQEMKGSQLQLLYQISELEQLIQQFRQKFPLNLKQWANCQTESVKIESMRKFILQSPFSVPKVDDYVYMFHKMHELKCRELEDTTSQKEFYRMLHFGGEASLTALQKMPNMLPTYKLIENAKKELLQLRPRSELLLPPDFRKIKGDLTPDQFELKAIQKCYMHAKSLRDKFLNLKRNRSEWQKYVQLNSQIARQPVNLSDIGLQIVRMKKELEQCIDSAQIIRQAGDLNSANCDSLVAKYKLIGIKNEKMEQFEALVTNFRQIVDLSSVFNRSNYVKFSKMCEQYPQISKIPSIRQIRESGFHKMYANFMQSKQKFNQLGEILIREGCYLMKKISKTQQILKKVTVITQKYFAERNAAQTRNSPPPTSRPPLPPVSASESSLKQSQSLKSSEQGYLEEFFRNQQQSSQVSKKANVALSRSESEVSIIDY